MIVLRVRSYNGVPADGPEAQFDEIGGTVGRSDNNQLVLPDPERTISRVHARVVFRTGGYAVVDNGSNPISVNGHTVGAGREQPLQPGDQLQIGGYLLVASAAAAPTSNDPFADLFGDAAGLAVPAPPPPTLDRRPGSGVPSLSRAAMPPAAGWPPPAPQQRAASAAAPQQRAVPAASAPASPAAAARLGAGHIPDDWDPFGPDPVDHAPIGGVAGQGAGLGSNTDALSDLAGTASESLDALFGLADLAGTPARGDPLALPLTAAAGSEPAATVGDHASDLHAPMPRPAREAPQPPSWPGLPPVPAAAQPAGAVFSWDDPPRDGRVVTLPGAPRAPGAGASAGAVAANLTSQPLQTAAPGAAMAPVAPVAAARAAAAQPAQIAAAAGDDPLLDALLQGLDSPSLRLDALTPDTMLLLGQLLRESLRGSVELLVARAALKREMRAEMTMIVARENNPLKFSPSVEVALQHLLGPPAPGFMPPAAAVRDAFDDLRAHQLGVMAGMRAALDGVLQRFDPQQLEAKLTRKSAINSIIPSTRKARLWELFQELFAQLQSEAQDDFDELFGKAFLKAYEDQLDRLQAEPGPR